MTAIKKFVQIFLPQQHTSETKRLEREKLADFVA